MSYYGQVSELKRGDAIDWLSDMGVKLGVPVLDMERGISAQGEANWLFMGARCLPAWSGRDYPLPHFAQL